jgi:hypothetical protein
VIHFRPFFNPSADFDWEPRYFRWLWLAWLYGQAMLMISDAATSATIYRREAP